MMSRSGVRSGTVVEVLEKVIEKEKESLELYRRNEGEVSDPALKSVFADLVEMRVRNYKELEKKLIKARSESEITAQINEMFY